jgi:hypothetical protein
MFVSPLRISEAARLILHVQFRLLLVCVNVIALCMKNENILRKTKLQNIDKRIKLGYN